MICTNCPHPETFHADDGPQWEPQCWGMVDGVRCTCPGFSQDRQIVVSDHGIALGDA